LQCDAPSSAEKPSKAYPPEMCSDMSALWRREWQHDWDGRAPPSNPDGVKVKVKGRVRHLIFVRHGQYNLEDEEHGLTDLGREQSRLLAERLAAMAKGVQKDRYGEIHIRYAGIWVSDVTRAMQTADIISAHLPGVPIFPPDPLLGEGMPTIPHPSRSGLRTRNADLWENSARIEAGFRHYVHRDVDHKLRDKKREKEAEKIPEHYDREAAATEGSASAMGDSPSPEHTFEIIVCHMNVIRYFTMRALQLPPEAWLRLRGDNTGITEIVVQPDGRVSLARFGDTGHLPIDMVTFH